MLKLAELLDLMLAALVCGSDAVKISSVILCTGRRHGRQSK